MNNYIFCAIVHRKIDPSDRSQPATIIRTLVPSDYPAVLDLVAGLPEWFDATARTQSIPIDLRHQHGFVATRDGEIAGFITLFVADGKLNIGWLGVRHDLHRQGIGRLLVAKATEMAQEFGVHALATYTLGDGVDYEPYARTRQFYFATGFAVYQRS